MVHSLPLMLVSVLLIVTQTNVPIASESIIMILTNNYYNDLIKHEICNIV